MSRTILLASPWEGWRLEYEGTPGAVQDAQQPHLVGRDGTYLLIARVRVYYRELACHFEATWDPAGNLERCALVGSLLTLTSAEWLLLRRGLRLISEINTPSHSGRKSLEETRGSWQLTVEKAEELKRKNPDLKWEYIAVRSLVSVHQLNRWRRKLREFQNP